MFDPRNSLHSNALSTDSFPGKEHEKNPSGEQGSNEDSDKNSSKGVTNASEGVPGSGGFLSPSRRKRGERFGSNPGEKENVKASSKEAISKEYIPIADASSREARGSFSMKDSGEIEAAFQGPSAYNVRVKRQSNAVVRIECDGDDFSGDILIGVSFIFNKSLTVNDYMEGTSENQQLKTDIAHSLKVILEPYINKDFSGVDFNLDLNVTSVRSDGQVLVDITVADNQTGNCLSERVDADVRLSIAYALIELDKVPCLKIGSEVYDIGYPQIEPNKFLQNQLIPAVCVTCSSHHNCTQRHDNDWFCQ
ncbi:unnamed protein product [Lymnaea stagnalis]|uniref:Uncharacterized protein n=1 Tax=Lymnaea stagnalis TaxID=6523 RepID=A0AAV2H8M4_LYMST